ncbi:Bypass of stop codon 6-like protein [Cladobotryum mycophilum]|uniref:Bypass of stop codon 6-like protein n=1 Tax=Cladobotryum mycophilum TaxID=491253 RepID=A0ABR0S960_9HYPO
MATSSSSGRASYKLIPDATDPESTFDYGTIGKSPDAVGIAVAEDAQGDDTDNASIDSAGGLERWNSPPINAYRFGTSCFALFVLGMHDGSLGALLPYIGPYYGVNYTTVSTVFVVPFIGYVITALTNNWIHNNFGQRGVAFMAPVCHSAYNAWVGNMHQANELLGLMHGAYGLGATISPLVATTMVTKLHLEWYTFFYIMIAVNALELAVGVSSFWTATGAAYRERLQKDSAGREATPLSTVLRNSVTWFISIFLLGYVGAEVSLGGWIPTFMIEVRHVSGFLAGVTATMFWLGLTLGRVVLGFITGRIGERLAIFFYLLLCVVSQLLYWLVPNFIAAIVFVVMLGFFLGPLFPAAIVVAAKLMPPEHHVSAIGFAAAIGSGGAAIIPFVVGAVAQHKGVEVLQPIVVAILIFIILIWLILPGGFERGY